MHRNGAIQVLLSQSAASLDWFVSDRDLHSTKEPPTYSQINCSQPDARSGTNRTGRLRRCVDASLRHAEYYDFPHEINGPSGAASRAVADRIYERNVDTWTRYTQCVKDQSCSCTRSRHQSCFPNFSDRAPDISTPFDLAGKLCSFFWSVWTIFSWSSNIPSSFHARKQLCCSQPVA